MELITSKPILKVTKEEFNIIAKFAQELSSAYYDKIIDLDSEGDVQIFLDSVCNNTCFSFSFKIKD